jgi:2-desacetyl-2-hydroxyethyl bacteriochlorophyllide A dehydrogenase
LKRRTICFTGPRQLELREEVVPDLKDDDLLVQTQLSAISGGTELLVYRGDFPSDLPDAGDAISTNLKYPLAYGYAAVGRVIAIGKSVDPQWVDRMVFGFQAHSSHFIAATREVLAIPQDVVHDDAVFLPNLETAVNLVQDAAPIIGERGLAMGQGVVGLLTTALLREFPLECLVAADRHEIRRKASSRLGVTDVLDPALVDFRNDALGHTGRERIGYDFAIELTGDPSALNDAIALTAFSGRIIVGSWFGKKTAPIELGGRFHRARIKLIPSQVSTIAPELRGRWDKNRRFAVAWNALRRIRPGQWITHRFSFERAGEAYRLLDEAPGQTIQVVFTYT